MEISGADFRQTFNVFGFAVRSVVGQELCDDADQEDDFEGQDHLISCCASLVERYLFFCSHVRVASSTLLILAKRSQPEVKVTRRQAT